MKKPVIVALCCLLALSTGTAAFAEVLPLFPHVQICSRFPHLMFRPKKAEKSRVRYQWKKSITL